MTPIHLFFMPGWLFSEAFARSVLDGVKQTIDPAQAAAALEAQPRGLASLLNFQLPDHFELFSGAQRLFFAGLAALVIEFFFFIAASRRNCI